MTAFWIAVVVGGVVVVAYTTLAVQAFTRVRRDILIARASGEPTDLAAETFDTEGPFDTEGQGVFTWKAGLAVVASTAVIVLLGLDPVFWYLPAILAVGTAVAVIIAFVIDHRSAA